MAGSMKLKVQRQFNVPPFAPALTCPGSDPGSYHWSPSSINGLNNIIDPICGNHVQLTQVTNPLFWYPHQG